MSENYTKNKEMICLSGKVYAVLQLVYLCFRIKELPYLRYRQQSNIKKR